MSFAVPNRDFKVVYYDRYSGISITHVLTFLGYEYLTARGVHSKSMVEQFMSDHSVYIVTVNNMYYSWYPTHSKEKLYKPDHVAVDINEVLADHQPAVQLILDSIQAKKEENDPGLVTVFESHGGDIRVYHAKTYEAFQSIAATIWCAGESNWKHNMELYSNQIFVIHVRGSSVLKLWCGKTLTNDYLIFDDNNTSLPGAKFDVEIKEALDNFCKELVTAH